jgi:hypothetical protein
MVVWERFVKGISLSVLLDMCEVLPYRQNLQCQPLMRVFLKGWGPVQSLSKDKGLLCCRWHEAHSCWYYKYKSVPMWIKCNTLTLLCFVTTPSCWLRFVFSASDSLASCSDSPSLGATLVLPFSPSNSLCQGSSAFVGSTARHRNQEEHLFAGAGDR